MSAGADADVGALDWLGRTDVSVIPISMRQGSGRGRRLTLAGRPAWLRGRGPRRLVLICGFACACSFLGFEHARRSTRPFQPTDGRKLGFCSNVTGDIETALGRSSPENSTSADFGLRNTSSASFWRHGSGPGACAPRPRTGTVTTLVSRACTSLTEQENARPPTTVRRARPAEDDEVRLPEALASQHHADRTPRRRRWRCTWRPAYSRRSGDRPTKTGTAASGYRRW